MEKLQHSPQTLAFVGDAYFGLLTRIYLSRTERPLGQLHKLSVEVVNANAQAEGYEAVKDMLSEEEISVFKRGRNFHTKHTPKNSTLAQYHAATGLECLFGYLKLSNNDQRAEQLFSVIWNYLQQKNISDQL